MVMRMPTMFESRAPSGGALGGGVGALASGADGAAGIVEKRRSFVHPRTGILLQIKNLEIGNGGVAAINLMSFGHHGLGEIVHPSVLGIFDAQ